MFEIYYDLWKYEIWLARATGKLFLQTLTLENYIKIRSYLISIYESYYNLRVNYAERIEKFKTY